MKQKTTSLSNEAECASNFIKLNDSEYKAKLFCHARASLLFGLCGLALTTLSVHFADKARKAYFHHKQWQAVDTKLDQALEDSGKTSESVASY